MILPVARYIAVDVLYSRRFLAPLLAHSTVLAVLFSNDPGALPSPWAASVLVLYPISAWCAIMIANCEEPVQRTITLVAAGGWPRVLAGVLAVCVLGDLALAALSVLWGVLTTGSPYTWSTAAVGVLAHLASALTGTTVGLLCARPVIQNPSTSLLLVVGVLILTATQSWLPPAGWAVAALTRPDRDPMPLLSLDTGLAAGLACMATMASVLAARRR
jgi:hypothetical protein